MESMAGALGQELALFEAKSHLEEGNRHGRQGNIAAAVDSFTKGIDLLLPGGTNEVLDAMVRLRIDRCVATNGLVMSRLNDKREDSATIERRCRSMIDDGTAVLDLPKHWGTPHDAVGARCTRVAAVSYLVGSLKVPVSEADLSMARNDVKAVLDDPAAEETSKDMVRSAVRWIGEAPSANRTPSSSNSSAGDATADTTKVDIGDDDIKPSFLTGDDLKTVPGLNIGRGTRMNVARSFMNKGGPCNMSDGTLKQLPSQVGPLSSIMNMTPAQLNRTLGQGAGTFFGELVFWKRYGGVLLGKQKWEAVEGVQMNDTGTAGEVWDMRWVFRTQDGARGFFRDMCDASRAEDGNGLFDENQEFDMTAAEKESLSSSGIIDMDCVAVTANRPRKRPKNMNPRANLTAAEMYANPTAFLQQYAAVYVVDRVVVKTYVIEGFNPVSGPLRRSVLFGERGLIHRAARTIAEWLDGTRTEYRQHYGSADDGQAFADKTACANCGKTPKELKQCTRCRSVAYCNRECQMADYKVHKKPCRKLAASR